MEGVLHVRRALPAIENLEIICFVFCKEELRLASAEQPPLSVLPMPKLGAARARRLRSNAHHRPAQILSPRPGVAEPKCRQQMQRSSFRTAVDGRNLD